MMVFGGVKMAAACEAFDFVTNAWTALPPMSIPREDCCGTVWQGRPPSFLEEGPRAFVFGGQNDSFASMSSAECFDPKLNRWSPIAPMSTARRSASAVSVPSRGILVMGGLARNWLVLQSVELYVPTDNQWFAIAWQLPKPLCDFVAHCMDGVLYIVGGMAADGLRTSDCWSMDLFAEVLSWSQLPPLPVALGGLASVAL